MDKITKLVLPVAGLGKRLLPLTLKRPKALVLLNKKPLLDYIFKEAELSGIEEIILIIGPAQKSHFQNYLKKAAKKFKKFKFNIRVQKEPLGNGHALLQAADLLQNENFAVRFSDDIIIGKKPVLTGLVGLFQKYKSPILLLEKIPKKLVSRYGVVKARLLSPSRSDGEQTRLPLRGTSGQAEKADAKLKTYEISALVEKPPVKKAPSNLIIIGGYILTPSIMANLKKLAKKMHIAHDSLPLINSFIMEIAKKRKIYGWQFSGKRLDCGTLDGLKKAEGEINRR